MAQAQGGGPERSGSRRTVFEVRLLRLLRRLIVLSLFLLSRTTTPRRGKRQERARDGRKAPTGFDPSGWRRPLCEGGFDPSREHRPRQSTTASSLESIGKHRIEASRPAPASGRPAAFRESVRSVSTVRLVQPVRSDDVRPRTAGDVRPRETTRGQGSTPPRSSFARQRGCSGGGADGASLLLVAVRPSLASHHHLSLPGGVLHISRVVACARGRRSSARPSIPSVAVASSYPSNAATHASACSTVSYVTKPKPRGRLVSRSFGRNTSVISPYRLKPPRMDSSSVSRHPSRRPAAPRKETAAQFRSESTGSGATRGCG